MEGGEVFSRTLGNNKNQKTMEEKPMEVQKRATMGVIALILLISAGVFVIVGCGGGGGDNQTTPPTAQDPNNPPVVDDNNPPALDDDSPPVLDGDPPVVDNSEIAAPDDNNDGTWDYIGDYINQVHPNSEKEKVILTKVAQTWQDALLNSNSKELSIQYAKEMFKNNACGRFVLGSEKYQRFRDELKAQLINTKARFNAYSHFNSNAMGPLYLDSDTPDADVGEDNVVEICGLDPNSLAN